MKFINFFIRYVSGRAFLFGILVMIIVALFTHDFSIGTLIAIVCFLIGFLDFAILLPYMRKRRISALVRLVFSTLFLYISFLHSHDDDFIERSGKRFITKQGLACIRILEQEGYLEHSDSALVPTDKGQSLSDAIHAMYASMDTLTDFDKALEQLGYITRKGKVLFPTEKTVDLFTNVATWLNFQKYW